MKEKPNLIANKSILITGAAGSIGEALSIYLTEKSPSLIILVDIAESPLFLLSLKLEKLFPKIKIKTVLVNIADESAMKKIFENNRINIVFHAAAYKHVSLVEDNPCPAVISNIRGTQVVVDLCVKHSVAKAVFYSTDKAVNPISVMGATKKIAEKYILSQSTDLTTQFYVLRLCNVYNSKGSVVPIFRENIRKGDALILSDPLVERMFVQMKTVLSVTYDIMNNELGGSVFFTTDFKRLKIRDLALKIAQEEGASLDNRIKIGELTKGERLNEELYEEQEEIIDSGVKMVKRINKKTNAYINLDLIEECIENARGSNERETVILLKKILPDYRSQNSQWAILDK